MQENITLIITGGTLDKDYNQLTGNLVFTQSHLQEMLLQANCQLDINLQNLMLKDSLDITDADRALITNACIKANTDKIIITHGTDSMVKTATLLNKTSNLGHKTIILTGAMRPFKLGNSDALFNLGLAVSALQFIQQGVYIAINGKIFTANNVVKDTKKGIFTTIT